MSSFDAAERCLVRYRACMDRDVELGIIGEEIRDIVDDGYADLERLLRATRIELEGAGPSSTAFREHFLASCSMLSLEVFRAMYRETDPGRASALVGEVRSRGRQLLEHLWARLEATA